MTEGPVYLDHHSTTPVDPRVLEAMLPFFTESYGNASSRSHAFGWAADDAVEGARQQVATLLGAKSAKGVVFTSGATESDNLAIKGVLELTRPGKDHVITCATEHKAVLDACKHVEKQGARVTVLGVDEHGRIDLDALDAAITERTALVSVMLANNEVGTLHPVGAVGALTRERGVLFHCDAVQGLGHVPFDVEEMNVDLVSVSAHKIYGPKGVGALWVRRQPRVRLVAQMDGGGHERSMRSGTLNVPGIVGLGEACRITREEDHASHLRALRNDLFTRLTDALEGVRLNGPPFADRHPGNLNVSFDFVGAEALMLALKDEVAVSSGSACTSASVEPSYVLRAMGHDAERASSSIRFGVGRFNTKGEIERVADAVIERVRTLRESSPLWRLQQKGISPDSIDW